MTCAPRWNGATDTVQRRAPPRTEAAKVRGRWTGGLTGLSAVGRLQAGPAASKSSLKAPPRQREQQAGARSSAWWVEGGRPLGLAATGGLDGPAGSTTRTSPSTSSSSPLGREGDVGPREAVPVHGPTGNGPLAATRGRGRLERGG